MITTASPSTSRHNVSPVSDSCILEASIAERLGILEGRTHLVKILLLFDAIALPPY